MSSGSPCRFMLLAESNFMPLQNWGCQLEASLCSSQRNSEFICHMIISQLLSQHKLLLAQNQQENLFPVGYYGVLHNVMFSWEKYPITLAISCKVIKGKTVPSYPRSCLHSWKKGYTWCLYHSKQKSCRPSQTSAYCKQQTKRNCYTVKFIGY